MNLKHAQPREKFKDEILRIISDDLYSINGKYNDIQLLYKSTRNCSVILIVSLTSFAYATLFDLSYSYLQCQNGLRVPKHELLTSQRHSYQLI